jgi:hypothetical protein
MVWRMPRHSRRQALGTAQPEQDIGGRYRQPLTFAVNRHSRRILIIDAVAVAVAVAAAAKFLPGCCWLSP